MGFDVNGTRFLLYAKRLGVDFSKSATIGRQGLHLDRAELKRNFLNSRVEIDEAMLNSMFDAGPSYADRFLNALGAREVDSFDYSNYEGANVIHDMNLPAPENFKEKYSVVIDGGSLEHVFNYPTAIKNCMEFVRPGGHFIAMNPTNNHLGHGFYQFSPELYFRVLVPDNGFEMQHALIAEERTNCKWWAVRDPAAVGRRVTLVNDRSTTIYVIAKKIASTVPLQKTPQQSDYVTAWRSKSADATARRGLASTATGGVTSLFRRAIKRILPPVIRRLLISPYQPTFFEEIDLSGKH
jgi:hypothetical protein